MVDRRLWRDEKPIQDQRKLDQNAINRVRRADEHATTGVSLEVEVSAEIRLTQV